MGDVSPHFSTHELECHHCNKLKINVNLIGLLEKIRILWGAPLLLNSVYRCPIHNKAVGGEEHSFHMQGMAADIDTSKYSKAQRDSLLQHTKDAGAVGIGIASNFFHVDVRPGLRVIFYYPNSTPNLGDLATSMAARFPGSTPSGQPKH